MAIENQHTAPRALEVSVDREGFDEAHLGGANFSSKNSSILFTSVLTSPSKVMKGGLVPGAKFCRSAGFLGRGEGQCQGWDHCQGLTTCPHPSTHTHTRGRETTLENFKGNREFTNCPTSKESVALYLETGLKS